MKSKTINFAYMFAGIILAVFMMKLMNNDKNIENTFSNPSNIPEEPIPTLQKQKLNTIKPHKEPISPEENIIVQDEIKQPEPETQAQENELEDMMVKVFTGKATEEEQLAFWEDIRTSDKLNSLIKKREQQTSIESKNIMDHMNLAGLYIAKLYTATPGPEQGIWAMKAERRWKKVLEIDPNNWEAQRNIAFSLSQYPDFLNKTGAAIQEFEKLLEIQNNMDSNPQHSDTYLSLYRLYQKNGDVGNAVDALKEGLQQFPDNEALIEQWNSVSTLKMPQQ